MTHLQKDYILAESVERGYMGDGHDSYDIDRMIYIHELTRENEELRAENRQLVTLLAKLSAIDDEKSVEPSEESYAELRHELAAVVAKLITFWAHHVNDYSAERGDKCGAR